MLFRLFYNVLEEGNVRCIINSHVIHNPIKLKKKCYVYNIFKTNLKWQVVSDCYYWNKKVISVVGSNLNK